MRAARNLLIGVPPQTEVIVLGAITGVGGGVLRDILIREISVVLRRERDDP